MLDFHFSYLWIGKPFSDPIQIAIWIVAKYGHAIEQGKQDEQYKLSSHLGFLFIEPKLVYISTF